LIVPSFPAASHRLEDQEQAPSVLRVQFFLKLRKAGHSTLEAAFCLLPGFDWSGVTWFDVSQAKHAPALHHKSLGQLLRS
jgi:hypothetical protein